MTCKCCGKCCNPVINIDYDFLEEYIKTYFPDGFEIEQTYENDLLWIYGVLKEITREEAFNINPYLETWKLDDTNFHFFRCPHLNENNKCNIHDKLKKGNCCDNFPTDSVHYYSENCGYKLEKVVK